MNSTSSAVTCHSNVAVVPPRSGSYPLCHVSRIYGGSHARPIAELEEVVHLARDKANWKVVENRLGSFTMSYR